MKTKKLLTFLALSFAVTSSGILLGISSGFASPTKLDRALVLHGGGFQTAVYLGVLDGVKSQGYNPDVLITTCGSSLASAIANSFVDSEDQRKFVESKRYYELLKAVTLSDRSALFKALALDLEIRRDASKDQVPDIFRKFLMNLNQDLGLSEFDRPFPTTGMRSVMVSGRINFSEQDAGTPRAGKDWFIETYFTDKDTAALLKGFESPIAVNYPQSSVARQTETVTDVSLADATRASISDAFVMKPKKIGDSNYITGAIDLYPNELAHQLASEIVEVFSAGFDPFIAQPAAASTFHHHDNERLRAVDDMDADYWVDLSDSNSFYSKNGFNPTLSLAKFKLKSGIPSSYEEYVRRVEAEWNYGRVRGIEALKTEVKNDKSHIRGLSKSNSSKELRLSLKKL